jgi:hypothetical protein
MGTKIIYIPLDERPCNFIYPEMILGISDIEIIKPPFEILGYKKRPADIDKLAKWMKENIRSVSYLIMSIDMFLFGGLVPSRLHGKFLDECIDRLNMLRDFKEINRDLKIYAFNLIMRVPSYNSADEEPDYYEFYGERIFQMGVLTDKIEQNVASDEEKVQLERIKNEIPREFLKDYLQRRKINHKVSQTVVDFVEEGIIDFLIIPMDDCSEYGFSAKERRNIMSKIRDKGLFHKIYSYPGADEVGSVLVARAFNMIKNYEPKVFIRYSSIIGPTLIPRLEDRSIHETVKYQIIAGGGVVVDNSRDCDFVLMVNAPSQNTLRFYDGYQSIFKKIEINDPFRNINEFVLAAKYYIEEGIPCALADVAQVNEADEDMLVLLKNYKLLNNVLSYAGWNTSSNTLGTVISHSMIASYFIKNGEFNPETEYKSNKFLFQRYLEDWGYQNHIRRYIINLLDEMKVTYFDLGDKKDVIASIIRDKLYEFKNDNLTGFDYDFEVSIPWNRLYEIQINFI